MLAIGGLISIFLLNIDDIDVAAEPIIWFIASPIALRCNSLSGSSSLTWPTPPIIRSVIILTSFSLRIKTLFPSSPSLYEICIITHGRSYLVARSSHVATATVGVVILTFWLSNELKVVAAVPILILEISPTASFSESSSVKSASLLADTLSEAGWVSAAPDAAATSAGAESSLPGLSSSVFMPFNNALISSCDSMPSISIHSPL